MRKLALLLALSCSALGAASKLVITSQYQDGRDRVVQLRNDSEIAATAFLVGTSETAFATTDILLGARDGRLLKTGDTAEVRVTAAAGGDAQVLAVIFEDGTTEGNDTWIGRLMQPRREVYSQLPFALSLLHNENVNNFAASVVAAWFHQWRERWLAGDATRQMQLAEAAETYLRRAGSEKATRAARELTELFEELSAKLAGSKPQL